MTKEELALRSLFAAVEARDASPLAALYSPEVLIHEAPSLPYGGDFRGLEGMIRHASLFTQTWDRLQLPADRRMDPDFVARGDQVLVSWRLRAHGSDRVLDIPMVSHYRLTDARIVESRMLAFDTAAILEFLAAQAPPDDAHSG